MKRLFMLVTAFVAVACVNRTASAQFGFGNQTPISETIQQERDHLLSQQQKYGHSASRAAAPAPRYQPSGRVDAYGRMDLSGRPAPGYPVLRQEGFYFSQLRYPHANARRRPAAHARTNHPRLRIPPPPPIH